LFRERHDAGYPESSCSLWTYVLLHASEFTNSLYVSPWGRAGPDPSGRTMDPMSMVKFAIKPSSALAEMKVWRFYVRLWDGVL
jgi:hypothetical protein